MSPDGRYVAVTAMNGSNKAKNSPFFNDHGLVVLFSDTSGKKLDQGGGRQRSAIGARAPPGARTARRCSSSAWCRTSSRYSASMARR